jgi:hypothetical protein
MPDPQREIEDLVDFYDRWPELRDDICKLRAGEMVTADQAAIVRWMVFMVDRVGPSDLEPEVE